MCTVVRGKTELEYRPQQFQLCRIMMAHIADCHGDDLIPRQRYSLDHPASAVADRGCSLSGLIRHESAVGTGEGYTWNCGIFREAISGGFGHGKSLSYQRPVIVWG